MRVEYIVKFNATLRPGDAKSYIPKKITKFKPHTSLLILTFLLFMRSCFYNIRASWVFMTTKWSQVRTNQRAPMAHRKWSQEQYCSKIYSFWFKISGSLPIFWKFIHFNSRNFTILIDSLTDAGTIHSTSFHSIVKTTMLLSNTVMYLSPVCTRKM